jgi:uncharacterized protein (TIGR00369 family)
MSEPEPNDDGLQALAQAWERANTALVRTAELPLQARERLLAMLQETPLHGLLGIEVVEQGPGLAVMQMPVRREAFNQIGNLHGGAIATLIDLAAGIAAARGSGLDPGKEVLVTADLHVHYLGRPHGDMVYARARVINAGRQLTLVDCQVTDQEDRIIAAADLSMMVRGLRNEHGLTPSVASFRSQVTADSPEDGS